MYKIKRINNLNNWYTVKKQPTERDNKKTMMTKQQNDGPDEEE